MIISKQAIAATNLVGYLNALDWKSQLFFEDFNLPAA